MPNRTTKSKHMAQRNDVETCSPVSSHEQKPTPIDIMHTKLFRSLRQTVRTNTVQTLQSFINTPSEQPDHLIVTHNTCHYKARLYSESQWQTLSIEHHRRSPSDVVGLKGPQLQDSGSTVLYPKKPGLTITKPKNGISSISKSNMEQHATPQHHQHIFHELQITICSQTTKKPPTTLYKTVNNAKSSLTANEELKIKTPRPGRPTIEINTPNPQQEP